MMAPGDGGSVMWIMVAVGAIVIVLGLVFAFRAAAGASGGNRQAEETPLEILEKRYARGEITKEEFETKKRDLGLY